jgi:hypothetical protein
MIIEARAHYIAAEPIELGGHQRVTGLEPVQ